MANSKSSIRGGGGNLDLRKPIELDFAKFDYKPFEPATTDDLVEHLDKNVAEALDTLRNTPDEVFMENWTMRNGETVYFTMTKIATIRTMCFNHICIIADNFRSICV